MRALPILALLTGILSCVLGLAMAVVGLGFANPTACGTGFALAFAGTWSVLAFKGLRAQRPITFAGLWLCWGWLIARMLFDFPAVASSAVLFLFLLPLITLPLAGLWLLLVLATGVLAVRHSLRLPWRESLRSVPCGQAIGSALLLILLIAGTLGLPAGSARLRARQIQALQAEYGVRAKTHSAPPKFGACSMSFLGYSLTQRGTGKTEKDKPVYERALQDAETELDSIKVANAAYFRIGASGDHLLVPKPLQEEIDDRYVAAVKRSGLPLVLVDTQHPDVCKKRKLTWPEFCQFQRQRITYYQERYRPDVYIVVCEPMSYHGFALTPETKYSAENWAIQLTEMCKLVRRLNPATRTGICLLVMKEKEPEWQVWTAMRTLPELDILSVEIYQPEDFARTEQRLKQYGHPKNFGKQFWIAETYNGWALNGKRDWNTDASWLRLTADYARVVDAEAALVWTFGTFVPGGNFWDFGNGKLNQKWGRKLSVVGETFRELALSE